LRCFSATPRPKALSEPSSLSWASSLTQLAQAGLDDGAAGNYIEITSCPAGEDAFWAGENAEADARIANRGT
jgi:hypothetical protein